MRKATVTDTVPLLFCTGVLFSFVLMQGCDMRRPGSTIPEDVRQWMPESPPPQLEIEELGFQQIDHKYLERAVSLLEDKSYALLDEKEARSFAPSLRYDPRAQKAYLVRCIQCPNVSEWDRRGLLTVDYFADGQLYISYFVEDDSNLKYLKKMPIVVILDIEKELRNAFGSIARLARKRLF